MGLPQDFPVHAALIALLSHLEMTEDEATGHWQALHTRRAELTLLLGRDPGLRVVALDYFTNEKRLLFRPKIVDEAAMEIAESAAAADGLTGLPNRRTFERAVHSEIRRAARNLQEFALAVLDLEGFRRVNATHGRAAGDAALREVATLIRARLRDMDLAGRLEGGRFGLVMPLTRRSGAQVAVERIRTAVRDAFLRPLTSGPTLAVTLSGGLAAYPEDADSGTRLLRRAEDSLAAARKRGGNQIVIHYREQRNAPRFRPSGAPLRLLVQRPGSDAMHSVRIRDISRSGALLEGQDLLEKGQQVFIHAPGTSCTPVRLSLEATVVRGKRGSEGQGDGCAGVRFDGVSPEAQASLDRLLEDIRRQGLE
jgi:diguanylate cyclase (GGDEF)-like protein